MCSGVGKSGSPAPKPMTASPCGLQRLGLGVDRQGGGFGDGGEAFGDATFGAHVTLGNPFGAGRPADMLAQ